MATRNEPVYFSCKFFKTPTFSRKEVALFPKVGAYTGVVGSAFSAPSMRRARGSKLLTLALLQTSPWRLGASGGTDRWQGCRTGFVVAVPRVGIALTGSQRGREAMNFFRLAASGDGARPSFSRSACRAFGLIIARVPLCVMGVEVMNRVISGFELRA